MKTLNTIKIVVLFFSIVFVSCLSDENKEKLKKTKQGFSNITSIVKNVENAKKDIEKLKDATPLNNKQLKSWLPKNLNDMERSGFKIGQTGYANVASVEGTYKTKEPENKKDYSYEELKKIRKKFTVTIIDGAGPMGSMAIAGLNMATKMDIEQEDEREYKKTVKFEDTKALQTYNKNYNNTSLIFVYNSRFGVTVKTQNIDVDDTWDMVQKLKLKKLIKLAD